MVWGFAFEVTIGAIVERLDPVLTLAEIGQFGHGLQQIISRAIQGMAEHTVKDRHPNQPSSCGLGQAVAQTRRGRCSR